MTTTSTAQHQAWCTDHRSGAGPDDDYCLRSLPAADGCEDEWVGVCDGLVCIPGGDLTPAEARDYGLRLITAAALAMTIIAPNTQWHQPWCTVHQRIDGEEVCTGSLPAADGCEDEWVGVCDGLVCIPGGDLTPAEARDYGLRLITAAALAVLPEVGWPGLDVRPTER